MNDEKMTTREWLPLIGLTVSAFLVNTSEFIPVGLLTDIAKSLGVTEAKAGILITGYSWTVTLFSLPLMLVFSRMRPRKLLLLTLFVFSLGQFLSVIAPGYAFLMIARICVASSHCIFWSIASPLAVRVVSRKHRSLALSAIVTGTSIAMVAGMPLGSDRTSNRLEDDIYVRGVSGGFDSRVSDRSLSGSFERCCIFSQKHAGASEKQAPDADLRHLCAVGNSLLHRVRLHRAVPALGCEPSGRDGHHRFDAVRRSGPCRQHALLPLL